MKELAAIGESLKVRAPAIFELLQPGPSEREVQQRLADLGLDAAPVLVEWWSQWDAEWAAGGLEFLPDIEYFPLPIALGFRDKLMDVARNVARRVDGVAAEDLWPNHWLPLMGTYGGGAVIVPFADGTDARLGLVRTNELGMEGAGDVVEDSLRSYLGRALRWIESVDARYHDEAEMWLPEDGWYLKAVSERFVLDR